jgi:hypothetical protein
MWTCVGARRRVQAVREGGREGEVERDRDGRRRERERRWAYRRERDGGRGLVSKCSSPASALLMHINL